MKLSETPAWKALETQAANLKKLHLRELLKDPDRTDKTYLSHNGIGFDFSRQRVTEETLGGLLQLAEATGLTQKIQAMAEGKAINSTEDRAVLHMALRANADDSFSVDGEDILADVHEVLQKIRQFVEEVRSGRRRGITGAPFTNVVAIGIGGSYLGPEFVAEALRTDPTCLQASEGKTLRFLANVDPIDVTRALQGLDPESTLVVVISKTFTTAETVLNARTVKQWLQSALGADAIRQHMVAVSTNLEGVEEFGIDPQNAFGFWDWVGGRYSVCSAVGVLPLALQFGWEPIQEFLNGARDLDRHFLEAPLKENIPVMMGLLSLWNINFLGHAVTALLPYCQALLRFPAHVQQVEMESNGKRVLADGSVASFETGGIVLGEPGTNGQHSFYQLLHQGRVVPADFLGFVRSQQPRKLPGDAVSNHDELMANFFAQPDALALGKTAEEVEADGTEKALVSHKVFPGNRPSNVLLMDQLTPFVVGQILALYEHRTAVQGFVWGLNSFDQWGVQLGKVLAKTVRQKMADHHESGECDGKDLPLSTQRMLKRYLGS